MSVNNVKESALIVGASALTGGVLGAFGPGVVEGAKLGIAFGVQVAVTKDEQLADGATRKTRSNAFDVYFRLPKRAERMAKRQAHSIEKVGNITASAILKVADSWSKLFLGGYALNIGLSGANKNMENYNAHCDHLFKNIYCVSTALTTVSLNMFYVSAAWAMTKHLYNLVTKDNHETLEKRFQSSMQAARNSDHLDFQ